MPRKKIHSDRAAYKRQWAADNYERIGLIVPKGRKEIIKDRAAALGASINEYINSLIERDIDEYLQ